MDLEPFLLRAMESPMVHKGVIPHRVLTQGETLHSLFGSLVRIVIPK
jgi:hypothetical protein